MKITGEDRKVFGLGAWVFALFAVVLSFGALWVAGYAMNKSEDAQKAAAVGGSGAKVTLSEFKIDPSMVEVAKDGTLVVTNGGKVVHNLGVKGTDKKTKMLKPGESDSLSLKGLKAGSYTIVCQVPGHEGAGMKATLMIGGAAGAGGAAGSTDAALRATDPKNNVAMKKEIEAYVGQLTKGPNTKGVGNQPLAPTVLADGTKEFDLTAKIVDWEVEQGKTVKAWTYNGTVPGPMIKVSNGDKVRIVLENHLPQSTSLHFHGLVTPNSMDGVPFVTQDPITPGKSFTYEFVAKGPAVGMYHSHDYAVAQVPDGMAGVFIVGDEPIPAGYGPVSQEVPMMLNDSGSIGLSLNGKSFPSTLPVAA